MRKLPDEDLIDAIGPWIHRIMAYPGFSEWKKDSLGRILDKSISQNKIGSDFIFAKDIENKHIVILSYIDLYKTWRAMADCEYYYRRFPFYNLPVSKDAHIRYMCEMFFNRIYEFSERMKRCLNAANVVIAPKKLNVGSVVKSFARDFKTELK